MVIRLSSGYDDSVAFQYLKGFWVHIICIVPKIFSIQVLTYTPLGQTVRCTTAVPCSGENPGLMQMYEVSFTSHIPVESKMTEWSLPFLPFPMHGPGFYLFIETSSPRVQGDIARIMSPRYGPPDGPVCNVTFWYHMFGATTGTLNVYTTPVVSNFSRSLIWSKSGNQGNRWIQGTAAITSGVSYRVRRTLFCVVQMSRGKYT